MDIVRVLPTKGRRTVGPWCFVDLMRPPDVLNPDPMEIGPHPHIGLATVTWLFGGEAEHSDSLGTTQLIRPGELNLMSAGHGIAHAEQGMGSNLHGAQMWLAQPEGTRHGASAFEHHGELPRIDLANAEATVIMGSYHESSSPARADTDTLGLDLQLRRGRVELQIRPDYEHAVVPIDQPLLAGGTIVEPGWLGLVPIGQTSLMVETRADRARMLLLGGEPLGERVQMWWNFVARTRDEITAAWRAWDAGDLARFGRVPSKLARIDAPVPPWVDTTDLR
jgi:redox-sensitive bicupin YhaK (pirin superfamily)